MTYEEYKKMVDLTHEAQSAYEEGRELLMSDDEYDALVRQIRGAETEHPEWTESTSPTQIITDTETPKGFRDVTHRNPMLSILDCFTLEDVKKWVDSVKAEEPDTKFSVEQKIDGTSLTCRYEYGKLVLAETRGNGSIGSDITENAKNIIGIPHELPNADIAYLEVRGEAYIAKQDFENYKAMCEANGDKIPANARNLAAGTLRSYDPQDVRNRVVRFFAFNVQESTAEEFGRSHAKDMEFLEKLGFFTVPRYSCREFDEIRWRIGEIGSVRSTLPYGIDGAVVKIDQIEERAEFPSGGSKYTPGHIAFKYPAEVCTVELLDVEVDIGKTGKVSFVGKVCDAITGRDAFLAGTYVSRVTLNNMSYIRNMRLGIGGQYTLIKSGDIIPKLIGCVKEPKEIYPAPTVCPHCGTPLVRKGESDLFCTNEDCIAAKIRTVISFSERDRMNIHGIGENVAAALVNAGFVKDVADLYDLKDNRGQIVASGVIGAGVLDNILEEVEKSKGVPASRVLAAINIPNTGRHISKDLIGKFGSIDRVASATRNELLSVEGVGPISADSILSFFGNDKNCEMVRRLRDAGLQFEETFETPKAGPLTGQTVVVTGKFVISGKNRKAVENDVVSLGGKVGSSIGASTTMLLVGEKAGSKLEKAKSKGIKILTEEQFLGILEKNS